MAFVKALSDFAVLFHLRLPLRLVLEQLLQHGNIVRNISQTPFSISFCKGPWTAA